MSSTFRGINTAYTGLITQQLSLDTVGNNISNASTTGYSRQVVNLVSTSPDTIYANGTQQYVGTGVTSASIKRVTDMLINKQYWQQNSDLNYWENGSNTLSSIENVFTDTSSVGLNDAINNFATALTSLASNSSDSSTRTNVLETAAALVTYMKSDAQSLVTTANDLSSKISTEVNSINSIATQIADLNQQILVQETQGQTANSLRDQRDNLVDQLSALANTQVTEQDDGTYTVTMSGVTLVQGNHADQLQTVDDGENSLYGYDTNHVTVASTGATVTFSGGTMQSLFDSRDTTVTSYLKNIDNMAQFLMQNFNTQQKAGYDNNGTAGENFFGTTGVDYTNSANDPTAQTPPKSWLSVLAVNSDFYATNGYNLIAARGTSTGGTADGTNATKLGNLLTDSTTSSTALGTNSLSSYYNTVVNALGVQSQDAQAMNSSKQTLFNAISNQRQSVSGVSIDEEMTNMIKFQQAYAASAKVMSTLDSMLSTLINGTKAS
ncbi:flagella basal body rod proteins signature [Lucifera butyrica]|uniref:Flagellar hook-associated protein 1 n=1 Tax=Lucifera butyrica TaxID=1351585 RepID=A0A498REK4_9FIRM|nr:flagellar hook-associated protein FlgK [Lucifera butyrica]VBB09435.1 flagella basal body rod proteins signature [Lucifera butyrica]